MPDPLGPSASDAFGERPGDVVGPYTLVRLIGEGGFGVVWLAERREPMVQQVAVKVIKPGMDSKAVIARFEQERQALAVMDHPGVAKVLDGGVAPSGRPYFVMEYVKGEPLTAFADRHRLTIAQRLRLFIDICDAVQHAHLKGLIHRDLKPGNILVSHVDDSHVGDAKAMQVKVIDFGVAKAVNARLTERTIFTEQGQFLGTAEYMSPDQAELGATDVDARTDVYSLGVILYELLSGLLPFDAERLRAAAYAEIQRIIREEDAPKPSTRLSSADAKVAAEITQARRQTRDRVVSELRRELEWIPLKALRKDRRHRYTTPSDLADDVRRYLRGEPLAAGPESATYRVSKFVRRHRVPVLAATSVVLALAVGLVVSLVARRQTLDALAAEAAQRREADKAKVLAQQQEAEAKKQWDIAEAVVKFQMDMLAKADPEAMLGDKVTVVQSMQAAQKSLDEGSLEDQPLAEASVRDVIGLTFQSLGRFEEAELNLVKALDLRRSRLPAKHSSIASSLQHLGSLAMKLNRPEEAERRYREALGIDREVLPEGHQTVIIDLTNLGTILQDQNRLAEAETMLRGAVTLARKGLPATDSAATLAANGLALLLQDLEKNDEAEKLFREVLAIERATLKPGHPSIATDLNNLARLLQSTGRAKEAEPLLREALEIGRAAYPAGHPLISTVLHNLALTLRDQHRLTEAEPLAREALAISRAAFPAGHPDIAADLSNLGYVLESQGRVEEAEPLYREALEISRANEPDDSTDLARGMNDLAVAVMKLGRLEEAESLVREALGIFRRVLPPDHDEVVTAIDNLGVILQSRGRLAEAEATYREALEINRRKFPEGAAEIGVAASNLAIALQDQLRFEEAEPLFREALRNSRSRSTSGEDAAAHAVDVAMSMRLLSSLLQDKGEDSEAESLLRGAVETLHAVPAADASAIALTKHSLAFFLLQTGMVGEAESLFREVIAIRREKSGAGSTDLGLSLGRYGQTLQAMGRPVEARKAFDESLANLKHAGPRNRWLAASIWWASGSARMEAGDAAAALPELEEAVRLTDQVPPAEHPHRTIFRETLERCRAMVGK